MTKNKLAEKRVIKYVIYLILCLANSYVAILFIYALEGCFKKEPIEREEKTDFKQTAYLSLGIVAIFMAIIPL